MFKLLHNPIIKCYDLLIIIGVLFFSAFTTIAQGQGSIIEFNVSGGAQIGDNITISVTLQANQNIPQSNMYFEIRAPDGTVVAVHPVDVPLLSTDQTFSYTWIINNASFPLAGDYSIGVCWSPGNSSNCLASSSSITFYSANTLSDLKWVALLIFGLWLFRRRKHLMSLDVVLP